MEPVFRRAETGQPPVRTAPATTARRCLGQFAPPAKGIHRITLNDAGVAAVQSWITSPASNFGVIFKDYAISDGVSISSSEASSASLRPKLIINYQPAVALQAAFASLPPDVSVGPDQSAVVNQTLAIQGTTADGGPLNGLGLLILWTRVSGPGTVNFGNPTSPATTAQFSSAGNYVTAAGRHRWRAQTRLMN